MGVNHIFVTAESLEVGIDDILLVEYLSYKLLKYVLDCYNAYDLAFVIKDDSHL